MKKDAYYFSHDSNARSDEKIIKLRTKHGWEGYGLYWAIIEKLRETKDYKLDKDYEAIAFDLHSQCERIKEIIENFGLFVINDKNFFSKSLLIRMKAYEDKKDKARNSANIRWNKGMRTHSERNANAMLSKVKESKVKESKESNIIPPSLEMVKKYCEERKNNINSNNFIDFYTSKNWFVGKNKMIDWQSAIRTWENRNNTNQPQVNERIL